MPTWELYGIKVRQNPERPWTVLVNFDPMPIVWEDSLETCQNDVATVLRKLLPGDDTYLMRVRDTVRVQADIQTYIRHCLIRWDRHQYLLPPDQRGRPGAVLLFQPATVDKSAETMSEAAVMTLECLLKSHEWYYLHSSDAGIWRQGEESLFLIRQALKKVLPDKALELWKRYAPPGFGYPG